MARWPAKEIEEMEAEKKQARDNGGPAFPGYAVYGDGLSHGGMTLRDYFAAKAMADALAEGGLFPPDAVAEAAYEYADAMLAARKK